MSACPDSRISRLRCGDAQASGGAGYVCIDKWASRSVAASPALGGAMGTLCDAWEALHARGKARSYRERTRATLRLALGDLHRWGVPSRWETRGKRKVLLLGQGYQHFPAWIPYSYPRGNEKCCCDPDRNGETCPVAPHNGT